MTTATAALPSFLQPFPARDVLPSPCQSAQFHHHRSLGSSHALWWPPRNTDQEPDQLLLFIPGNPGLVDFYIPFLSELHVAHAPNLAIVAHGLLDHFPGIENESGRYSPDDSLTIQVETSLEVLDAVASCYSKKPSLILVGHSVGSWITLQMISARPTDVSGAFLLFPTISSIASTPNGRLLSPIFAPLSRKILSSLSFLVGYIPERLFVKLFPDWPDHQLRVLRGFLASPKCIMASLSMAHEEMKTIGGVDMGIIEPNKERLWFYYGQEDDWVGNGKQLFLGVFDPLGESSQVLHGPSEIPHAFCINHGDILAKQCCDWLISLSKNVPSNSQHALVNRNE